MIYVLDNVRKMPSASLDTDAKYTKLVELYANLNAASDATSDSKCKIFENVFEALNWLTDLNTTHTNTEENINVLVTGSLYLVGLSLKVLNFKID